MRREYEFEHCPVPRYGHGKPAHPELLELIERRRPAYARHLGCFPRYAPDFLTINVDPDQHGTGAEPQWGNHQMPRLAAGVWIQVHDVYRPFDYPPDWMDRDYTEQYLLACHLLAGANRLRMEMPNACISKDAALSGILEPLWRPEGL